METIFSLVTKPINQNVSIIRISGPNTFKLVKDLFKPELPTKGNEAVFRKMYDLEGKFIDDTIILIFKNPSSYTGEDLIEIQSHGNMYVVRKILNILEEQGIKKATPGEFTQQAFVNKKLDLDQAEAVNALVNSENDILSEMASQNLNGKQSNKIDQIIDSLIKIIADIKISIDYPENDDVQQYSPDGILKEIKTLDEKIMENINESKVIQRLSNGITVVIVGMPNAGKSTLLNSILDDDKAIVSNTAGTTRDVVEANLLINGIRVTLQDTAGIHTSNDEIELLGIEKSINKAKSADILIGLYDSTRDIKLQENEFKKNNIYDLIDIKVFNKNDISDIKTDHIKISAEHNDIELLLDEIKRIIEFDLDKNNLYDPTLITEEQIKTFEKIHKHFINVIRDIEEGITFYIV
jgi:tRNA modification GTPase